MVKTFFAFLFVGASVLPLAVNADGGDPGTDGRTAVLDADSLYRIRLCWKTPIVATESGEFMPLRAQPKRGQAEGPALPAHQSSRPARDWSAVDFDDSHWPREMGKLGLSSHYNRHADSPGNGMEWDLIFVRSRFIVDDPAPVEDFRIALAFRGGAVVRLNGEELTRAHLPPGEIDFDTPAEIYPKELYVKPDGTILKEWEEGADEFAALNEKRTRRIADFPVPSAKLRKGVNVLAIEIHRAPVHEAYALGKHGRPKSYRGNPGAWSHADLESLRMTAASPKGIRPNVSRPEGLQVWTARSFDNLLQWHYGEPGEQPRLDLQGVRNGSFSGQVIISGTQPIRGLKTVVGELKSAGGSIPASAIEVRYARACDPQRSFNRTPRFEGLMDAAPTEVPVGKIDVPRFLTEISRPANPPVAAAVQPIWIGVRVPRDAKPGRYAGTLRISAEGLDANVPLTIEVRDWRLPDPADYVSRNNLYQSHESSAMFYGVPLWSDRHFELMGEVLRLTRPAANRMCTVHLVERAYHMGNSQSMVRWIDKGNGQYDHDFAIFDRYLDLYEKELGKPHLLLLSVFTPGSDETGGKVTLVDPATGKVESRDAPAYTSPEGLAFWKAMLEKVRARLEKRGWSDVAALGTGSDRQPTAATVAMFKQAWPDGRWMSSSHMNPGFYTIQDKEGMPVPYREHVWAAGSPYQPGDGSSYPAPWSRGPAWNEWGFPRAGCGVVLYEWRRMMLWRMAPEATLQGNLLGVGRVGADFWPVQGDDPNNRIALSGTEGAHLGPSAATRAFVTPGPDGPLPTTRLLCFAEGTQVREAMIVLQRALLEEKIDGDLADRCRGLLDERARVYLRAHGGPQHFGWVYLEGSDVSARDGELFALCAEVARNLSK
ncbi:MAG: glycoside hydrolase domain-containing protein [Planctomycetales bacterium]